MARKSGGEIPVKQAIADANQAVAMLDTVHHWSAKRVNRQDVTGTTGERGTEAGR